MERPATGLEVRGADGVPLFRYGQAEFLFAKTEAIPPLLVKTLLFLENRDLDNPATPWQNPVIEWDRTLKAAMLLYRAPNCNLPVPVQGGSTLAVQLEKFRHSPHGRTDTPLEKLRQIVGASLKAYSEGANTRVWREKIIIDYLNTVPLAAAPGYGEIHGLGEGLYAWFGMRLNEAVAALNAAGQTPAKVRAFKHILTLLISVRAPSEYLVVERASLEDKVDQFTRLMARAGIIDWEFAAELQETPIDFLPAAPLPPQPSSEQKQGGQRDPRQYDGSARRRQPLRPQPARLAGRQHLRCAASKASDRFLNRLADPKFVKANGLNGERLLEKADPSKLIYSFLLVEATPAGNLIRVQADNSAAPLDFNKSVKLELGSTAKLRTFTHYLELVGRAAPRTFRLGRKTIARAQTRRPRPIDPMGGGNLAGAKRHLRSSRSSTPPWHGGTPAARTKTSSPAAACTASKTSTNKENDASASSAGRVSQLEQFAFHSPHARPGELPPGAARLRRHDVLDNPTNPTRRKMLEEIAEEESRQALRRAYQNYARQTPEEIVRRVLGKGNTERRLTILFFAWRIGQRRERAQGMAEKEPSRIGRRGAVQVLPRVSESPPHFGRLWLFACAPSARSLVRRRASQAARAGRGKISMPAARRRARSARHGCSTSVTAAPRTCACASAWKKTPSNA